ncbi:MAG: hypothetical protein IJZ37_05810 [Clostridia bacterium]|nr:hypothetical protein [Clostridia bacterium]MBQ8236177.1 hypothetical protein [Clostridia bacterium]MBQ8398604.1 hypothetical protein [Clostridia bacterium]
MTIITVCAIIMALYQSMLTVLLILLLEEERKMLYRFLSGRAISEEQAGGFKRPADRMKELKKRWRMPFMKEEKGDERH